MLFRSPPPAPAPPGPPPANGAALPSGGPFRRPSTTTSGTGSLPRRSLATGRINPSSALPSVPIPDSPPAEDTPPPSRFPLTPPSSPETVAATREAQRALRTAAEVPGWRSPTAEVPPLHIPSPHYVGPTSPEAAVAAIADFLAAHQSAATVAAAATACRVVQLWMVRTEEESKENAGADEEFLIYGHTVEEVDGET